MIALESCVFAVRTKSHASHNDWNAFSPRFFWFDHFWISLNVDQMVRKICLLPTKKFNATIQIVRINEETVLELR